MKYPTVYLGDGQILTPEMCHHCYDNITCLQWFLAFRDDLPAKQVDGKWTCDEYEHPPEGEGDE